MELQSLDHRSEHHQGSGPFPIPSYLSLPVTLSYRNKVKNSRTYVSHVHRLAVKPSSIITVHQVRLDFFAVFASIQIQLVMISPAMIYTQETEKEHSKLGILRAPSSGHILLRQTPEVSVSERLIHFDDVAIN